MEMHELKKISHAYISLINTSRVFEFFNILQVVGEGRCSRLDSVFFAH